MVLYLKNPPDRDEIMSILGKLEDEPADLVRKDAQFKKLELDADDYTDAEAVADLLVEHPKLLQRPVVVKGKKAIIGRPTSRVEDLL
ncbi:MAG: hypothetical protein OSA99_15445 [Acidimicrobiales bacterium]|nr:hypothetical protein [Acidimicrobiales bacterium]